jgi:hypothetical protein
MIRIKKKKAVSKTDLKFQEKEGSESGLENLENMEFKAEIEKESYSFIQQFKTVGLPLKNQYVKLKSVRALNALGFIKLVLEKEEIEETIIYVYSIDEKTGKEVDDLAKDGKLGKTTILISNLRNSAYRRKDVVVRSYFIKNPMIKLIYAGSHAKLIAIKTKSGNFYTCNTSANMTSNSRIEDFIIVNCESDFNTERDFIEKIDQYVTQKELAVYDFSGEKINGENKFKTYQQKR